MPPEESRTAAWLSTLAGMLQSRVELLSLEAREQRIQLTEGILLVAAAVFFAMAAIIMFSIAVVLFFRESALMASLLLGLFYLAVTLTLIWHYRRRRASWHPPFACTVEELRKDREWLQSQK